MPVTFTLSLQGASTRIAIRWIASQARQQAGGLCYTYTYTYTYTFYCLGVVEDIAGSWRVQQP